MYTTSNRLFARSLTRDLILGLSLALAVFLVVLGAVFLTYQTNRFSTELEKRTDLLSDKIAQALSRAAWDLDVNVAENIASAYLYSESVVGIHIVFVPETVIFDAPPANSRLFFSKQRAIVHELTPGQYYDTGSVTIWFSREGIRTMQADLVRMVAITLVFSILFMILALQYFMIVLLHRPLFALQQSIRAIADGNYHSTIQPVSQQDVNAIITDVNRMADRIGEHTRRLDDEIRERRQVEQSLRERNQQLQTLSDNLPSGYVYQLVTGISGATHQFSFVSAGMERLHGITVEAVLQNATLLYDQYQEDLSLIRKQEAVASRNMTQFRTEARYRHSSGDVGWMSFTSAPRPLPDGNIIWDGIAVDITERKNTEAALLRRNADLKAAERLARMGSWKYDSQRDIFTGSEETFRIIGLGVGGELPFETVLAIVHADDQVLVGATIDRLSQAPQPFDVDLRITVQDQLKWVRLSGDVEIGADKETLMVRGMLQDITERKQLEIARQEQDAQLAQASKMTALGALVAGVAHEINNPNNLIMLNAPLLERAWNDAVPVLEQYCLEQPELKLAGFPFVNMRAHVHELFSGIHEGSRRIARIISELKDFARQSPLNMSETVNINGVVESALVLIGKTIPKYTDDFRLILAPQVPPIRGDHQKLEQVVVNLLLNACQSLTGRQQAIVLETRHVSERNAVVVRISDQGEGINPKNMNRIFDPFYSTRHNIGGTGLGLPISFSIIQDHGGSLHVDSRPGEGTVVTVSLNIPEASASPSFHSEDDHV